MLLQKLVLTDFGVYRGRNEFDLTVEKDRPVVLFGGKNGAGKTTLFVSIPLCLYGRNAIEPRPTQKQYRDKLRKGFHIYQEASRRAEESSISLEFLYYQGGSTTSYRITRMWHNDADVTESLYVYKKGQTDEDYVPLDHTEQSMWQAFVDRLFPRNVTRLFFFNGEEIHRMAKSGGEDAHIRSSFDALLGLDIVDQLHDDIGMHMLRNTSDDAGRIMAELDAKRAEKKKSEERMTEYAEKRAYLAGEIERRRKQAETDEAKFLDLGGQFASDRADLLKRKAGLERTLDDTRRRIGEACSGTLPLLLVPDQLGEVREHLVQDRRRVQDIAKREVVLDAYGRFADAVKDEISKYDAPIRAGITEALDRAVNHVTESTDDPKSPTFNFSTDDMQGMIRVIDGVQEYDTSGLRGLSSEYDRAHEELAQVKASLEAAPQQDEIAPIFSRITGANREIGEMEGELGRLEDLEAQEKSMITMLNVQMRQALSSQKADRKRLAGLELAPAVQDALRDYSRRLRLQKIRSLEENIMDGLRMLLHKDSLVGGIRIDPETFDITLYNKEGEPMDRGMMSEGELQIYVTSIVWGLAKTSGRALPVMVDTPLSRLDDDHRMNLLEGFYPRASHQTIILSTNTEITGPYYDAIRPHVSRAMLMSYGDGRTVMEEGYFDREEEVREVE